MTPFTFPAAMHDEAFRIAMTSSCHDCDALPKVPEGGTVRVDQDGTRWQIMFNGIEVLYGGYDGEWMAEIIRRLKGHHEPQEELAFYTVIERLQPGSVMFELGCFWGYYSIWFGRQLPGSRCIMCEPDPEHLALARKNAEHNGITPTFIQAAAGKSGTATIHLESADGPATVQAISVADIMAQEGIEFIDLLHLDVQGAERDVLETLCSDGITGKLRFVFVSTHHFHISGDPLIHERCLDLLQKAGAHIICEHTVEESYSGDGMIVASFQPQDKDLQIEIARNRASSALFRPVSFDFFELTVADQETVNYAKELEVALKEVQQYARTLEERLQSQLQLQHQLAVLEHQRAGLERQLAAVYASSSWRIAAPLRAVMSKLRRGKTVAVEVEEPAEVKPPPETPPPSDPLRQGLSEEARQIYDQLDKEKSR